MRTDNGLEREVAAIGGLSRDELVARWQKQYGCPPPSGVRRELLIHSAVWHHQAKRLGGFSASTRKLLRDAIGEVEAEFRCRQSGIRGKRDSARIDPSTADPSVAGHGSESQEVPIPPQVADLPSRKQVAKPRKRLDPGARLLRDWNGRTHVVDVIEDGFVFEGKVYRSLSVIARTITGAHWSGPRFFGL